tara:strand:- start:454 stop:2154 length:1701 start_codon:yes stop_codon:yes gene_type:complete
MYILGLHNDEDSGVCLLKNGKIIDIINEERLTRKKLQGGFPSKSLSYILKKNKLKIDDIDYFAYGWHGRKHDYSNYFKKLLNRVLSCNLKNKKIYNLIFERLRVEFTRDNATYKKFFSSIKKYKIPLDKTFFYDHHASHAWSAFSCSPFNKALVFTMDARGDLKSASVSIADKKKGLKELTNNLSFDSLGFLYGQITYYLGYKPHRHEGKITGLAAYGNPFKTIHIFKKLINWDGKKIVSNLGYYRPFFTNLNPGLVKDLRKYSREDIAAGLQYHCENIIVKFVKYWIKKVNQKNINSICLAGGLFANVKINQKIREIKGVSNIFVFPHMGDGGLTVGAAANLNFNIFKKSKIHLKNVNYGPSYNDKQIKKHLKKYKKKILIKKFKNIKNIVVEKLINKKVVGFFQGRMEFGPRALGSRSILFHTKDKSVNDWLNKRLRRTEFMPFAPVTTEKLASKCFEGWNKFDLCAPFMTRTFKCKKEFSKENPAVVHIDGTARPQVIKRNFNKIYFEVVRLYCKKTGNKSLINTSFNQHEEPIVCTPEDAINSLIMNNVDYLAIGNYLVEKK